MFRTNLGLALAMLATEARADCSKITTPQERLACYDKPAAAKATVSQKAGAEKGAIIDSGWQLAVKKDAFSDKTNCLITPIGKPNVQVSIGNLFISYKGQGNVKAYTVRLDDQPPKSMQLASSIERQIGALNLSGEQFVEAMKSERLRIQTLTVLDELKNEDLQMKPARRLYEKMGPECEKKR